jgi:hypothetical protein
MGWGNVGSKTLYVTTRREPLSTQPLETALFSGHTGSRMLLDKGHSGVTI